MGWGVAFAFKQRLGLGLDFSLPLAHLYRTDYELLRYLVDCLYPAHRFKAYLGFELR